MDPLIGRTVSQIKNRYYQNLKGKDLDKIKYIIDDENSSKASTKQEGEDLRDSSQDLIESKMGGKRDQKQKEKDKNK